MCYQVAANWHGERRPQGAGHHVRDEFGAFQRRDPSGRHRRYGRPGGAQEEAQNTAEGYQGDHVHATGGWGDEGEQTGGEHAAAEDPAGADHLCQPSS